MEPIISPWLFYAISVCDTLNVAGRAMLCIAAVLAIGVLIAYLSALDSDTDNTNHVDRILSNIKPFTIATLFFSIFGFLLVLFVPSRDVAMQMLAASIVTPDNVAAVQGNIVDFISEVAKAIAAAKN